MSNPPLDAIAAKARFEAARAALEAFRNQNAKLIEQHDLLVAAYNDSLKSVKDQYRTHSNDIGRSWGEFRITVKTEIDAKKLLDLMPNAEPLVRIDYKIIKEEWDRAVSAELIPRHIIDAVTSEGSISVYGPKEA